MNFTKGEGQLVSEVIEFLVNCSDFNDEGVFKRFKADKLQKEDIRLLCRSIEEYQEVLRDDERNWDSNHKSLLGDYDNIKSKLMGLRGKKGG